jgi:hypothetical protein
VTVGRVRNVYLVPREHPTPGEVRDRLDRVSRDAVTTGLRVAFSRVNSPDDRRVWFIRRIDLSLAFDSTASADSLVHAWGNSIARQLATFHTAGPDDETVVVFPSREAFVARYIEDRARGNPTGTWYYAEFDSLAVLPAGTAIQEALARDPARAPEVLRHLAREHALESVLDALTPHQAREIWRLLAPITDTRPVAPAVFDALINALPRAGLRLSASASSAQNAIRWFVSVPVECGSVVDIRRAVDHLLLALEDVESKVTPSSSAMLSLSPTHRDALRQNVSAPRAGGPQTVKVRFAGLFLAWGAFLASEASALCPVRSFRYLVTLKLLGRSRVIESWQETIPLLAAGLDWPPGSREWSDFATSANLSTLRRDLTRFLVRRGTATGRLVVLDRVGDVLLFRDTLSDAWLHGVTLSANSEIPALMRDGVGQISEVTGEPCDLVTPAHMPDLPGYGRIVDRSPELFAATVRPAAPDLAHFSLIGANVPPGVDAETDLVGTLVARLALRAFAARLRGFSASSADYLYRNFLAVPGMMELSGTRVNLRLEPPPLHLVLRLAGCSETTFPLPDGRLATVTMDPD